jgi:competence protein ComEC
VAVRVTVGGGFTYLNPGDATTEQEEGMLERWPADSLRAVVLKAGHHGSRTSSGRRWLAAVSPRLAVISAGAGNPHGHPHPKVLRRLEAAGVDRVWRTDRDGDLCVEVRPDGAWRVRGEEGWRPGAAASGA